MINAELKNSETDFYNTLLGLNKVCIDFEEDKVTLNLGVKFKDKYNLDYSIQRNSLMEFISLSHDNDKELLGEWLVRLKHSKINVEKEIEFRCQMPSTTKYSWVRLLVVKTSEKICYGALIDIDINNRIIQSLKKDKQEYESILNDSNALIAKYNLDGELLYASNSLKMINGSLEFIHSSRDWYKGVLKQPYISKEIVSLRYNGVEKWFSFSNKVVFINGEMDHILTTACDITKSYKQNMRLSYETHHDLSTGLFNRLAIKRKIGDLKTLDNAASFIIKVNEYRELLSKYGHENMDLLISKIAMNLYDKNDYGFIVGRYCDNKLIVILLNYISHESIKLIKEDVIKSINKNYKILDESIEVSISSGYAMYPEDTDDLNKLIYYSEVAMQMSKNNSECIRFEKSMRIGS